MQGSDGSASGAADAATPVSAGVVAAAAARAAAPLALAPAPAPATTATANASAAGGKPDVTAATLAPLRVAFVNDDAHAFAVRTLGVPGAIRDADALQRVMSAFRKHTVQQQQRGITHDGLMRTPGLAAAVVEFTRYARDLEAKGLGRAATTAATATATATTTAIATAASATSAPALEPFDFYVHLLPRIVAYALHRADHTPLPLLESGTESSVHLRYSQVRYLLAHAFFGNISRASSPWQAQALRVQAGAGDHPDLNRAHPMRLEHNFGDLSFDALNSSTDVLAVQRLVCQLAYFYAITFVPAYARTFAPLPGASASASASTAAAVAAPPTPVPELGSTPAVMAAGAAAGAGAGDATVDAKDATPAAVNADTKARSAASASAGAAAATTAPVAAASATASEEGGVTISRHVLRQSGVLPYAGADAPAAAVAAAGQDGAAVPVAAAAGVPDWAAITRPLDCGLHVHVHTASMEEPPAPRAGLAKASPVFVNFANQYLHIGQIIPSLTQEEVLFSAAPEHFVGLLCCEVMRADEVLVIRGARRVNAYTGYLHSFRFAGLYDHGHRAAAALASTDAKAAGGAASAAAPPTAPSTSSALALGMYAPDAPTVVPFDSVAIDSVMGASNHFVPKNQLRDLNKAYLGFRAAAHPHAVAAAAAAGAAAAAAGGNHAAAAAAATPSSSASSLVTVSTGNWGCGAFGGDKHLKFLQQAMAANVAGVRLAYSTFRDQALCASLTRLSQLADRAHLSVGACYTLLQGAPVYGFAAWIEARFTELAAAAAAAAPKK